MFFALNVNKYIAIKNNRVSLPVRLMQLVSGLFELLSIPLYKIPGMQSLVEKTLAFVTNPIAFRMTLNGIIIGVVVAVGSTLVYENIREDINIPVLSNNSQSIQSIVN